MSTNQSNHPGPNQFTVQPPPEHHIHRDSEPLPGTRGQPSAPANYDASVTNDERTWQSNSEKAFGAGSDTRAVMSGGQHSADPDSAQHQGRNAFTEERPLNVQPTNRGMCSLSSTYWPSILTGFRCLSLRWRCHRWPRRLTRGSCQIHRQNGWQNAEGEYKTKAAHLYSSFLL